MELESLPTEDELQQYAKKKREQQQELDDLHKMIEDLEVKLANEDDEETLAAKLREVQQSNAELEAELKKSAEQPANPDAIKIKAEMVRLNLYRTLTITTVTNKNDFYSNIIG